MSQVQQGSRPERYPEQGLEVSPTASGVLPGPDFQRGSLHLSLPYTVEASSSDPYLKDPALPSSNRPISLLDTIGKLFEKILLARILHEVSERGMMRDEQFGFRSRHSTSLQLARLVEKLAGNFGEKSLTGAVFLDVAKAFDTFWIDGVLYKLTILPPGSDVRGVLPDGYVISSMHAGWGGSGWSNLTCPPQSVCQRHALTRAPRVVCPLRGRTGHHSHFPQADAAC